MSSRIVVSGGNRLQVAGRIEVATSAFNPASIPDFRFWYDFTDLTTMWQDTGRTTQVTAPGDPVEAIDNKFDITGIGGVTTAGEPYGIKQTAGVITYEDATSDPNPANKNPHADFTATGPTVSMVASTPSDVMTNGVDSWTGYAVFPVTPSTLSSSIIRKVAYAGAVTGGNLLGTFGINAENNEIGIRAGFGGATYRRSPTKTITGNANEWMLQTVVVDLSVGGGTVVTWRINGVDDIGNLTATTGIGTGASYHRGIAFAATGTFDWIGRLGEVLVYRGQHTAMQIAQVEAYLTGKWNLDP